MTNLKISIVLLVMVRSERHLYFRSLILKSSKPLESHLKMDSSHQFVVAGGIKSLINRILGGTLVVDKKGKQVSFVFREEILGSRAPLQDVLKACESIKN